MTDEPLVPESLEVQREAGRRLLRQVREDLAQEQQRPCKRSTRSTAVSALRWQLLMPDELLGADPGRVGRKLRRLLPTDGKSVVDQPDDLLEWWDSLLMAYVEEREG